MTYAILLQVLLALPLLHDGNGLPIRRPKAIAAVIAQVVADDGGSLEEAITLDVLAAHESGYHVEAYGDSGRSCHLYQTPCRLTPPDPLGQTRLALKLLRASACPHPLWTYASGRCAATRTALRYEAQVEAHLEMAHHLLAIAP